MNCKTLWAALAGVWLVGCASLGEPPAGDGAPVAADPGAPTAAPHAQASGGTLAPVATTELHGRQVAVTQTPVDLWDRIRRGYALPDLDTELVREKEQWYAQRPDYIQRMTERSRMYIFHIVEELELRGMPTELALLPYIESAFNPQAVSSAKAAGMWQFMPATGSAFDLRQNMLRDDRRDVIESTRAALDYLQQLHQRFGDWHLALAAYNWGQGNVNRAIERNRAAGLGTGYLDLNMPAETRHYVPKLQAVKNIIANPDQFGAVLPLIENHPFFDTVEITRDIDVDVAARLAGVRLEDFKALNPSQRKPVIFAAGTPRVLLPWNNAAIFKENLAKTPAGSLASWTAWVAPANMPSREVASRFGMDRDDFLAMNNLPRQVIIKSGSTVLVRRNGDAASAVASHVVDNAHLAYVPEVVLRRTSVRARRGDTLASIAARYDLPVATVAGWNKLGAKAKLKTGQSVVLYLPVRAGAARASAGNGRASKVPATAKGRATAKPASKSTSKSTSKSAAKPSAGKGKAPARAAAKPATKPGAKPAAKSAAKKPAAKPATKPSTKGKR